MEKKILEILKDNKEWNSSLEYTAKELLKLFNVNQQREILIATLYGWKDYNEQGICIEDYVDEIVSNL